MLSRGLDVAQRSSVLQLDFLRKELSQLAGGHPHCQHSVGDRRPRSHDGTRGDPGILSNDCSVEHDRSDSYQCPVADSAYVYDSTVSDGNLIAQERWIAIRSDVQGCLILDIRAFTDSDSLDIAAQNGSKEDTRIHTDFDIADDGCARRDPHTVV